MWEKKPILLLVLATISILIGTTVTMIAPFAWVNTESDKIEAVKPYNALELAGRDVYIREGCNNCHSQTIRPLVAEVLRYGDYSKSGEFIYDRPHLWGSRRTGPDLARIGGKYPDSWHYQHMRHPVAMIPQSNMPAYAFLDEKQVDPEYTRKKMQILNFPYTEVQIQELSNKTEMDAMVAYLQKLGNDIPWRQANKTIVVGDLKNPFLENMSVIDEGSHLVNMHCVICHDLEISDDANEIGLPLTDMDDFEDAELFTIIHDGLSGAGMPSFSNIGATKIWKILTFLKSRDSEEESEESEGSSRERGDK